jgi:hypothetical protein
MSQPVRWHPPLTLLRLYAAPVQSLQLRQLSTVAGDCCALVAAVCAPCLEPRATRCARLHHTLNRTRVQDTRSAWPVLRAEGPIPPPLLSVHARSSLKLWASCRGCQHASATLPSGVLLCTHWYLRRPPLPPRSPGRTLPAVSPRGHCWRLSQVNLKQAHAYPLRNAVVLLKQPVCLTRAAF